MRLDQTPFGVEWNVAVDFMASLKPIHGSNMQTHHTPFGVARMAVNRRVVSQPIPAEDEIPAEEEPA